MTDLAFPIIFGLFIVYLVVLSLWKGRDKRHISENIEQIRSERARSDLWAQALKPRSTNLLNWISGIYYLGIIFFAVQLGDGPQAMAVIIVATALGAFALGDGLGILILKTRVRIVEKEGTRLLKEGKEFEVEALLDGLVTRKEKRYQSLRVDLLQLWGSFRSMSQMLELDPYSDPNDLESAKEAGSLIKKGVISMRRDTWKGIRLLVGNCTYWKRLQLAAEGKDDPGFLIELENHKKVPKNVKSFFKGQHEFHQHFPAVYCKKDLRRPEIKRINGCRFIRCPYCFSTDHLMVAGESIHGEVGGEGKMILRDGVLKIPLWDEESKEINLAEVDQVTIFGIEKIDWAVAATVERLENGHPQPLPRIIIDAGAKLSLNSIQIVKEYNSQL